MNRHYWWHPGVTAPVSRAPADTTHWPPRQCPHPPHCTAHPHNCFLTASWHFVVPAPFLHLVLLRAESVPPGHERAVIKETNHGACAQRGEHSRWRCGRSAVCTDTAQLRRAPDAEVTTSAPSKHDSAETTRTEPQDFLSAVSNSSPSLSQRSCLHS